MNGNERLAALGEDALQKLAERESRLAHLLMSRPEWAPIDLRDALHELLVDIVVVAKSEDIHLHGLFHGAIGDYFQITRDESIFNEI